VTPKLRRLTARLAEVAVHRDPPTVEGMVALTRSILLDDFQTGGPPPVSPRLVFLHIMKTAGTSLSELVSGWVPPGRSKVHASLDEVVMLPRPLLARLQFLAGHLPFEALSLIPGRFETVTVLRDPVARAISHYAELVNSRPPYEHLTLDEFVSSDLYDVPSGNYQARHLALRIGLADAWVEFSPHQRYLDAGGGLSEANVLASLFDSTPLFMSDEELLDAARKNLAAIDHVGTAEDLPALARDLATIFGAEFSAVPRLNVSRGFDRSQLSPAVRRRLEERTAVDRELYSLAASRALRSPGAPPAAR